MPEIYFVAGGDGTSFEPVAIQIIRSVKFKDADSRRIQTVLVRSSREIPGDAFLRTATGGYSHFILTCSQPEVDLLLPLKQLPISAGLNPFMGSVDMLIHTGEIDMAEIGSPVKIDIYLNEKDAWKIYNQLGGRRRPE